MKKKISILTAFLFCAIISFGQNNHPQSNSNTIEDFQGAVRARKGVINGRYADTATANLDWVKNQAGIQIVVADTVFIRNRTATKWISLWNNSGGGSTISIYNDSTLVICNLNGCDSFKTNIVINNFNVLNDSTIIVCPTSGSCDTIIINPQPFNKPYPDSTIVQNGVGNCIDTISYYINGNRFIGGYINHCTLDTIYTQLPIYVYTDSLGHQVIALLQPDGYTGIITWSGTGLTFNASNLSIRLNNTLSTFNDTTLTLAPADPTYSRYDVFGITTTGVFVKEGTPSPSPTIPTVGIDSFAITSGFLVNPGDTVPSTVTSTIIYNENVEWIASTEGPGVSVVDFNNTDNPYKNIKDIFVSSYQNSSNIRFVDGAYIENSVTQGEILSIPIYSNGVFNNNIYAKFYDSANAATQWLLITNSDYGFNRNDSNAYQIINVPLSAFIWTGNKFTTLYLNLSGVDTSRAKGFYFDYIRLQSGIPNIPQPSFQDSNHVSNDSLFWCVKGICKYLGQVNGSGGGGSSLANFYLKDSTLSSNRTVMGSNNLTFTGIGNFGVSANQIKLATLASGATTDSVVTDSSGIIRHRNSDSTLIPNFSVKVRSLFSANAPITYNSGTGKIAADTSTAITGLATQYDILQFYNSLTGTDSSLTLHKLSGDSSKVIFRFGNFGIFNIGTGFRWVKPTDTVKTLVTNAPIITDSATANVLTIHADTSTATGLATIYQNSLKQTQLNGTGYVKFSGTTPSYLTPAQVTADLNLFTSSLQGLVPSSGGGTTNFLRADGTWAAAGGSTVTTSEQEVTVSGTTATFTSVPATYSDYMIFRNGVINESTTDFTTSGNIVTGPNWVTGDRIVLRRTK